MPTIEFHSVQVLQNGQALFEPLNETCRPGRLYNLTGPSGSGKSSLLKALLGFGHMNGQITLDGRQRQPDSAWRSTFAYMPQKSGFHHLDNALQLYDYLPANRADNAAFKERWMHNLKTLDGKEGWLERKWKNLSGGEQQLCLVSFTLSLERGVCLLDEPTSAMDAARQKAVIDRLKESGRLTLLVSHDRAVQQSITDRITIKPLPRTEGA